MRALSVLLALTLPASAASVVEVSVGDGPFVATEAVAPLAGQRVRLRVRERPGAKVRWVQVLHDVTTMYKNANFPWDPDPYKWVGLAAIRTDRENLTRFEGRWEVEPFAAARRTEPGEWTERYRSPIAGSEFYRADLGTFWFQAEVEKDGRVERVPAKGLRVSVRDGPGYLGWLSSYLNVPGVFGSVTAQANGYLGVDCADAVTAAWGGLTGRPLKENLNVAALVSKLPHVAEFDWGEGGASHEVRWGRDVRPGDLLAVRYVGARTFQHVGALVSDEDGDGRLTPPDRVLHAGPLPLAYSKLGVGPFQGYVAVLRPAPRIVERPISFSLERLKATADYIKIHAGEVRPDGRIQPRMVVLHWTGSDSLEADFKTFDRETLPGGRSDIAGGGDLNVSAHFLVGKDGTILRLMPEDKMARHVIGLNLVAIGIENVGGVGDRPTLTPAQAEANAWLAATTSTASSRDLRFGRRRMPAIGRPSPTPATGSWRMFAPGWRI
ncbi:MAG: hypothetical protein FD126_1019 [Elusimicrobia bacterium]|nr:MAG: hypothetical protein FD126_1019 [Elusimicrobiota bacterium]